MTMKVDTHKGTISGALACAAEAVSIAVNLKLVNNDIYRTKCSEETLCINVSCRHRCIETINWDSQTI